MSPWLPIEETTAQHRKIQRAAKELRGQPQSEEAQALGHAMALWLWSLSNCDDGGAFPACDGWLMERGCYWKGDEGALVEILCRVGLLERAGDMMRVHGWQEHQGKVRESLRSAADKQRRSRERRKAQQSVSGDVPGYVPSKTDRQTDKKDLKKETKTNGVSQSVSREEEKKEAKQHGEAIEEASQILEAFPCWNLSVIPTRTLVAELFGTYPDVDVAREFRAWREQVLDKGQPDKCEAALRGWMKKARTA